MELPDEIEQPAVGVEMGMSLVVDTNMGRRFSIGCEENILVHTVKNYM